MASHRSRNTSTGRALAACALLAIASAASAACPAVGATTYIGNTCSTPSNPRAPCYKQVVNWKQDMFQNGTYQGTLYTYNLYANGYYQWVYQGTSDLKTCRR